MYYITLDNIISALNISFDQVPIDIIRNLDTFNLEIKLLKTKIDLLKHTADLPNYEKINVEQWIKWL